MPVINRILNFVLTNWMLLSLILSITVNISGGIMWFAKTRKYWREGNEAKARLKEMETKQFMECKIRDACAIVIKHYRDNKNARIINRDIIKDILYDKNTSSLDELIIDGCLHELSPCIKYDNSLMENVFVG